VYSQPDLELDLHIGFFSVDTAAKSAERDACNGTSAQRIRGAHGERRYAEPSVDASQTTEHPGVGMGNEDPQS
jgi:hypothetical protein